MKTVYIAATLFLGGFLTACNSGLDQNNSKNTSAPATQNNIQLPATTAPATGTTLPQNTNMSTSATGGSVALNPAHGQPGHNCDLAVGAPLNGAAPAQMVPANNSAAPVQTTTLPAVTLPQSQSSNPSARLNPAHGQPGHDCAVEVGKPLKQ